MAALAVRQVVPGRAGVALVALDALSGREVVDVAIGHEQLGADGPTDGCTVATGAHLALDLRRPLVLHIADLGLDPAHGIAALHGWGQAAAALAACSGVVPIVATLDGPATGGLALLLGLADFVVMTPEAVAHVASPSAVEGMTGLATDPETLGSAGVHLRTTGLAAIIAEADGLDAMVAALLAFLPDHCEAEPPEWPTADPADRATPEAGAIVPSSATGGYDVRDVARSLADDGDILEVGASFAPNLVTAYATIGGRPVGIVANQPVALAGTLDIAASQKGARFVGLCDAFNVPLVSLVDTPGFQPGKDQEWRGMIRHGAKLAFAYAAATVPRICVVLRKAYGGAYIVMDCKTMGNDVCLAWPTAEIAVMGAAGAVEILHRSEPPDAKEKLAADYAAAFLNPDVAARRGYVDEVIDPAATRARVALALRSLRTKRRPLPHRPHDNRPI